MSFPHRPPFEIVAELFDSCSSEMAGDPIDAANKAAYYLFQELIQRIGESDQRCIELSREIEADPDAPGAEALRQRRHEISFRVGLSRAKWIFQHYGKPLTQSRANDIKSMALIDRLDLMHGGHNVKKLAREIAHETVKNPTAGQIATIERHIQKLNAKRKKNPFWPQRVG